MFINFDHKRPKYSPHLQENQERKKHRQEEEEERKALFRSFCTEVDKKKSMLLDKSLKVHEKKDYYFFFL